MKRDSERQLGRPINLGGLTGRVGRRALEIGTVALMAATITRGVLQNTKMENDSTHSSFHTALVIDSPNSHSSLQLIEGEDGSNTGKSLYIKDKASGLRQEIAAHIETASWAPNGRDIAYVQKNGPDQIKIGVYDTDLKVLTGEKLYRTPDVKIGWEPFGFQEPNDPNNMYAVHVRTSDVDLSSQVDLSTLSDWVFPISYTMDSSLNQKSPTNSSYLAVPADDMNHQIATLLILKSGHLVGRIEGANLPYWSPDGNLVGFNTVGTGGIGIFDMKSGKVVAFTKFYTTSNNTSLEWSQKNPNRFEMVETNGSDTSSDGKVLATVTYPYS